jgi:hypothetical protein
MDIRITNSVYFPFNVDFLCRFLFYVALRAALKDSDATGVKGTQFKSCLFFVFFLAGRSSRKGEI